ncbi:hypothetical protein Hanom_Chr11g00976981 [Helianthus anomalus]
MMMEACCCSCSNCHHLPLYFLKEFDLLYVQIHNSQSTYLLIKKQSMYSHMYKSHLVELVFGLTWILAFCR